MKSLKALALLTVALSSACSPQKADRPATAAASGWSTVSPSIRVNAAERAIEFDAVSVIKTGFLEEYVCTVGTREHESLFAFDGKASEIHAALLLAGLVPGAPGRWRQVGHSDGSFAVEAVPPQGEAVRVSIVLPDGSERAPESFVRLAPVGAAGGADRKPPDAFVVAGSRFVTSRKTGVERYAADASGSLVGLVTFGDETIAPVNVVPDQASVSEPVWEAATERMPEPGTRVKIRIRSVSLGNANALPPRNAKEKGPVETEPQTEPFRGQGK
jgi:hypothetical protein